jgi:carboxyl-terminal processing protease
VLVLVLVLGVLCAAPTFAGEDAEAALDAVFGVLDERFLRPGRVAAVFTEAERSRLRALARREGLAGLGPALDERLRALGVSHTRFVADGGFDHAFYRSLFDLGDPDAPAIWHLRAFLQPTEGGAQRVINVPEGGPAAAAGLRRGDLLRRAGGGAFRPVRDLASGEALDVDVARGTTHLRARLVPEYSSPHRALIEASRASTRVLEVNGRRIGYFHLWSGTHEEVLDALDAAVLDRFRDADGVILDLRGGFGGAWHDHLDPFFPDREGFFEVTSVGRDGDADSFGPGPRRDVGHYDGPLVVLVDEGTRSGKEALAHQFRRSGRGLLVGATTAGAFTAGLGTPGDGWFLYAAVAEPLLDGVVIEGRGVAPRVAVPWPADAASEGDPQLAVARARLLDCIEAGAGCGT